MDPVLHDSSFLFMFWLFERIVDVLVGSMSKQLKGCFFKGWMRGNYYMPLKVSFEKLLANQTCSRVGYALTYMVF